MTDQARFRGILGGLAEDGWHGEAGPEFVELIGEVLSAKSSTLECSGDCVSEAVLVVAGCGGGDLGVFAARLLAMDNPLGYVITSVATNLDRAAVEDVMGVGSRQVGPGVEAVTRFSELSRADDGDGFDHVLMQDAWARGVAGGSVATFQWCSWASGGAWGCGAEFFGFGFRGAGLVAGLGLGLADPVRQAGEAGAEVLGDVLQVGAVLTVQGDTDDVIAARLVGK
ncbi:hypothetical protein [Dermabacter hominis]|uniref:hypothetical protein n=1 Tax=Dermabacter hominis TaxID=36740 RepID=UPI000C76713A|nr:hypothetical protein CYJ49_009460 [Dermabacter hominis]